jgi:hypothetical protein
MLADAGKTAGKRRMKKTYVKPTLEKRGALGSVATIGQVITWSGA